ncbi:DUF2800 domain-containing protein [Billgrantia desiderata]|uniref:DUF2800 domain-containing protein n=1 Tax=Billgrantia desiderata TaxID=52021 RepID=UPI001F38BF87|nr:DUF2800 domain-containing protein [Halomonas desiderata]
MTPSEHSNWGPSAAHRRIICRGSGAAEELLPETDSPESREGTMHHTVLEKVLLGKGNAFAHVGSEHPGYQGSTIEFTRDQARVVQAVADRVEELQGKVYPEVRVDLSAWIPGQFGTSDIGIVRPDSLRIRDAKFGRGDIVIAHRNPQCMLYAAGFWVTVLREDPDVDPNWLLALEAGEIPVILEIDQPYKGNFDRWETDLPTCLRFAEEYAAIYRECQEGDQPRTPGPAQCLYCKAKPTCRPYTDYCLEVLGMSVADLELCDKDELTAQLAAHADSLTPEQRAKLYGAKSLITKLLEDAELTIRADYEAGKPTGGLKLIPGAKRRVWRDEDKAREALTKRFKKEQVVIESLISPTKALDLAGPRVVKKIEPLIEEKHNKPTIVPENHKTPGLPRAVDHFDDLGADDEFDFALDGGFDLDDFDLEL